MSILTGSEIRKQRELGNIVIDPWDESHVGPNSVDLTLDDKLLVYEESYAAKVYGAKPPAVVLDMRADNRTKELVIPPEGLVLLPNRLYLGSTREYTETHKLHPRLDGRSSIGRLGLCIHVTAAYGDIGFRGRWTLELTVVHPLRVYAGVRVCQISYQEVVGDIVEYAGKYQDSREALASRLYRDLGPENRKPDGP